MTSKLKIATPCTAALILATLGQGLGLGAVLAGEKTSLGGQPLSLAFEPLAGVRWSYLRGEVEFSGGPVNLPQADRSESFFDPIVGARVSSDLSEAWLALISADVGGFHVGSDYSWNVQGHVGYRATVLGLPAIFSVGYRALHQKYQSGDFKWEVTQHGPMLGMAYTFKLNLPVDRVIIKKKAEPRLRLFAHSQTPLVTAINCPMTVAYLVILVYVPTPRYFV